MKNYYEILEVDKHASSEIIDKAFRTLAKRYHPDMHEEDKKDWAEKNFKQINEAYEVLSDNNKRKKYDMDLAKSTIDYSKKYKELFEKQQLLKQELDFLKKRYSSFTNPELYNNSDISNASDMNFTKESEKIFYKPNYNTHVSEKEIRKNGFHHILQSIYTAISNTLKRKRTFKDLLALFLTVLTIIIIISLLWNIPFTRNYLISFYEENSIINAIVNIFIR